MKEREQKTRIAATPHVPLGLSKIELCEAKSLRNIPTLEKPRCTPHSPVSPGSATSDRLAPSTKHLAANALERWGEGGGVNCCGEERGPYPIDTVFPCLTKWRRRRGTEGGSIMSASTRKAISPGHRAADHMTPYCARDAYRKPLVLSAAVCLPV